MATSLRLVLLLALVLPIAACDSGEEPEVVAPDPMFQVSSIPRVFDDGTPGLQFAAIPNTAVVMSSAVIRNPVGATQTYNLNNALLLAGQGFDLQDPDIVYFRVSGTWTFTFTGINESGAGRQFSVSTTIPVQARTRN